MAEKVSNPVWLTVERDIKSDVSTGGRLFIDGDYFSYTLEDPVRKLGLKIPGETAIQAGIYRCKIEYSPHFHRRLVELIGVPQFTETKFHNGSSAKDTKGCILIGNCRGKDCIWESRKALDAFMEIMEREAATGRGIFVEVINKFED